MAVRVRGHVHRQHIISEMAQDVSMLDRRVGEDVQHGVSFIERLYDRALATSQNRLKEQSKLEAKYFNDFGGKNGADF